MAEFYLITGFLGSGKTTLLKNILDEFSARKRIAVIQNEFAPTGMDGKELKNTGNDFKLVEINNGSVFCVCMLGNFIENLQRLIEKYDPEMIFLEASGLSDPVNIIELLQADNLQKNLTLSGIISIVDAVNFERGLKTLPRFRHQIMIADLVLVNKTDLFKDNLKILHKEIKEMNPFSVIKNTSYCKIPSELIFSNKEKTREAARTLTGIESEGRPEMNAVVLRTNDKMDSENLDLFLNELQKVSVRIKGYINLVPENTMAVQTVFDQRNMKMTGSYAGPSELIVFSEKIDVKELRKLYKKYISE